MVLLLKFLSASILPLLFCDFVLSFQQPISFHFHVSSSSYSTKRTILSESAERNGFGRAPLPSVPPPFPSIDAVRKERQEKEKVWSNIKFPTRFTIKVIGKKDETFTNDMLAIAEKITSQPSKSMKISITDKGKYSSVSFSPVFTNSTQIYAIYELVSADPRVQFVL